MCLLIGGHSFNDEVLQIERSSREKGEGGENAVRTLDANTNLREIQRVAKHKTTP